MTNNFTAHTRNTGLKPGSEIFFLWLSHKFWKNWEVLSAFCNSTNSWKIIDKLIDGCLEKSIFRTNLVKWVPLCKKWKLRYPNEDEKSKWLNRLKREISVFKPKMIYLFWKQVSDFVLKNLEIKKISDNEYIFFETKLVLVEHPSYIAVYRRKYIGEYIEKIVNQIKFSL